MPVARTAKASKKTAEFESIGTGSATTAVAVKSSMATVLTPVGELSGAAVIPILATCCPETECGANVTLTTHPTVVVTTAPGIHVVPIGSIENDCVPSAKKTPKGPITNGDIEAEAGATTKVIAIVEAAPMGTFPKLYVSPLGKNTPKFGGGGHQPSGEKAVMATAVMVTKMDFARMATDRLKHWPGPWGYDFGPDRYRAPSPQHP